MQNYKLSNYKPFLAQSWHYDDCARISIILQGKLHEATKYNNINALPLDIVIKTQNIKHENHYSEYGAKILSFKIDDDILNLNNKSKLIDWSWLLGQKSHLLASKLIEAFALKCPELFEASIIEIIDSACIEGSNPKNLFKLKAQLHKIREKIYDDICLPFNIVEYSKLIDIHPVYLARAYKNEFGISIQDDRQLRRIKASCDLLVNGKNSIVEIANDLNFFDQSHFTRLFKKYTKISPTDFKKYNKTISNFHI